MKRIILFIILANIYLGISSAQEVQLSQKHGWDEDYPLYGEIYSLTELKYDVCDKFGELVKELKSKHVIVFKEQKRESISYDGQGQVFWKSIEKYDSNWRLVETTSYNGSCSLYGKHFFKYDLNGNMIEQSRYNEDGSLHWKSFFKYDINGNEIEDARYKGDGSLDWRFVNKYDSNANRIEHARYEGDGTLDWIFVDKYDSNGNKIEHARFRGEGLPDWNSHTAVCDVDAVKTYL